MTIFVVGLGASGDFAHRQVEAGLKALAGHDRPVVLLRGRSRVYGNPPWGNVTRAPFANAAAVVESTLPPWALLGALFALETRLGRIRREKNAARALDLDVLWSPTWFSSSSSTAAPPHLPHPRFLSRSFAVVPAVEALEDAGVVVPLDLRAAARIHGVAPLRPLPTKEPFSRPEGRSEPCPRPVTAE
jgi:2-amino-4-hydroxy-6-hydroxymethyldihydropteridine diphosphokinase